MSVFTRISVSKHTNNVNKQVFVAPMYNKDKMSVSKLADNVNKQASVAPMYYKDIDDRAESSDLFITSCTNYCH